jgi:potassium-dependent mechanosensitive channel
VAAFDGVARRSAFGLLTLALALVAALNAGVSPAYAQTAPPAATAEVEPLGPLTIATGIRAVQESADAAEREVAALADLDAPREMLRDAEARQLELNGVLEALAAVENTRPERLFRLRDLALANEQRLQQQVGRLSARLSTLAEIRAEWLARLGSHTAWLEAVPERPDLAPQIPEIRRSLAVIEGVLERVEVAATAIAEVQAEAQALAVETRSMVDEIAAIRAGRREGLLQRDQPMLLSPAHLASLREPSAWVPGHAIRADAIAAFAREHTGLLLLHLMLILATGLAARHLRKHTVPEGGWSGLLLRPWAFAIFGVTALLARRYLLAPPLWDVVTWSLLAGSGAVLAAALLRGSAVRLMIVAVASVYPLMLLAEALLLPAPLFRVGIAAAAATALIGFPLLARQSDPGRPTGKRARTVLSIASALSAAVLIAQFVGLDQLSRWLVHATLTSAYVVLAVAFLIVMGRGALRTLLRKEFIGRVRLIGTVAVPLAERLLTVLQVVLVIGGALVLLDVWEVAPAPLETWNLIVNSGFDLAGARITVGRILLAALLVYLAMTVSWLARTIVNEEAARSWSFERGVADSINTLVHYAVITLGIIFGLGALGVELQNFAIVAGAVGVGIGFGLQTVVNNFVSGLILLFERPVRVGDTVEIEGEWGTIKKIGLRSTVVITFTQSELIVPNADLVSQKVTNWTLTNPVTRVPVNVGVAYGSDVQKVLQILTEAGAAHPSVSKAPAPAALFMGFGDSSLDFELRIWVDDISSRLVARSAVLAEIDRRFREEGIEIPFPQRDLNIRTLDPAVARAVLSPAGGDHSSRT